MGHAYFDDVPRSTKLGDGRISGHIKWPKLGESSNTRWWFQLFFYVHPYLGKISILTHIFQMGWNHQPEYNMYCILLYNAQNWESNWGWIVIKPYKWSKAMQTLRIQICPKVLKGFPPIFLFWGGDVSSINPTPSGGVWILTEMYCHGWAI